jgi:predicted nuclease of predicted toxin-antitoxin system
MRFLVDQPVSPRAAEWLRQAGHEAWHVRERGLSRASDEAIFAMAVTDGATIVTTDLDFSRIVALSGRDRPGVVLFRAGNISDDRMLELLQRVLAQVPSGELERSVVVVDEAVIRVAPLPLRPDLAR